MLFVFGGVGCFLLLIGLTTTSKETPQETQEREANELIESLTDLELRQLAGKDIT